MQAKTQATRRVPSHPSYQQEGLSPKKTALIIVIVVGCIAILWPKVFQPMMFGGTAPKPNNAKEQRGPGGCCDVVLERQDFLNTTPSTIGPQTYRKQLNLYTGEMSIRQERPSHLHPESIYQAMRERGRAIPATPTVPILERKGSPSNPPPRIVEGRPGPIPGMRPPMGAGSLHQPQTKGSSMGFILPIYTIGIVVFFGYTIMKLVFKKPLPNAPYGSAPHDPSFRKEVFGHENGHQIDDLKTPKLGTYLTQHRTPTTTTTIDTTKNGRSGNELYNASVSAVTAASNLSTTFKPQQQPQQGQSELKRDFKSFNKQETEQLMEIEKLRKKLEDTERAMAKLIAEMNSDKYEAKNTNENSTSNNVENISNGHASLEPVNISSNETTPAQEENIIKENGTSSSTQSPSSKRREGSAERSVAVLGMELTASREGGQKWNKHHPATPMMFSSTEHSKDTVEAKPQSIYLEGALAHESQILVADSETKTEEVYDDELNGTEDEPAVVLSSKMTLSLISLDPAALSKPSSSKVEEIESPLADDIEIIGHDNK